MRYTIQSPRFPRHFFFRLSRWPTCWSWCSVRRAAVWDPSSSIAWRWTKASRWWRTRVRDLRTTLGETKKGFEKIAGWWLEPWIFLTFHYIMHILETRIYLKQTQNKIEKVENLEILSTGWWFGSFFTFPYIGNVIIPTDFHIFQRGRYTTNQIRWRDSMS